jgi:hypothetical protein
MALTMRSLRLVLPLLAALAGCATSSRGPGPRSRPADYYPLAVGAEWTWEDQSPQLPGGKVALRTVRVLERTRDGYFKDSARGELRAGACIEDRDRSLLCGPIAVGTRWSSVLSPTATENYEIVSIDERVTTPAGSFQACVKVRAITRAAADIELINEITYAPGVGPVRIEVITVASGKAVPQFRAVLRAWRPGSM